MRLVILYGSQTGTAQDVAEQIWRDSKQYGFNGPVLPIDEYPVQNLFEEQLIVFVAATTGNGDEPDNMKKTWRFLLRKSLPSDALQQLHFACLGLGDSSYSKFNFASKKLNKRLLQLGAQNIMPLGLCDDQHDHGLGAVALPWQQQLWVELQRKFQNVRATEVIKPIFKWNVQVLEQTDKMVPLETLCWPLQDEYQRYTLLETHRTTAATHFQDVRLLKFQIPNNLPNNGWQPGDVFNVRPCNSSKQVDTFFDLVREHNLNFTRDTIVKLNTAYDDIALPIAYAQPVTVGLLAKYIWDLSAKPRQRAFELLALNCEDELEKEKLIEFTTTAGLDDLIQYINRPRRNILEVLEDFRHATSKIDLHILFELFSVIQPRSFSIASMPSNGTLDILVAVVEYKTKLSTPRLGLCSNWLKDLQLGCTILGCVKRGTMSLPRQLETPIIMIGPGTGIAPFRSIVQHKCSQLETEMGVGDLIIFFGCRGKEKDFHFRQDFEKWQNEKLAKTFIAFSRDQEHKIYVQHLIRENKDLLQPLIKAQNAVVLVAGSSKNMPKEVKEAIISVLGGDADYVEQMIKTKRYQEETWS